MGVARKIRAIGLLTVAVPSLAGEDALAADQLEAAPEAANARKKIDEGEWRRSVAIAGKFWLVEKINKAIIDCARPRSIRFALGIAKSRSWSRPAAAEMRIRSTNRPSECF